MRWYESREKGLGVEFVALVDEAFRRIADSPERWPLWREGRPYRKKVVRRFPYTVFFTTDGESATVLAVAHQRRRPGYWVDR